MVTAMVTPWRCIQTGTKYPIAESNAEGGHSVPTQQNDRSPPPWGFFVAGVWLVLGSIPEIVLHPPLHRTENKKPRYLLNSRVSLLYLGWLMGLEPTTTGITILDSTN